MTKPNLLVLDLDGTLVDTAHDLVATLNWVLQTQGLDPLPLDVARNTVGHGARSMLEAAYRIAGRDISSPRLTTLTDDFIDHYSSRLAQSSRPFPGAVQSLDRFADNGWLLAICTNKIEALARELLSELGLAERFAAICGGDTFTVRKPDPFHLTETIRIAGGSPDRAIMVGDSITDIDTAKAAGIPVVAVSFGYSATPVRELGPDRVIDHFDDLRDAVTGLLSQTAA
jgi:phosphoglycolate phosphatase